MEGNKRVKPYQILIKNLTSETLYDVEVLHASANVFQVLNGVLSKDGYEIRAIGPDSYAEILNCIMWHTLNSRYILSRFDSKESEENLQKMRGDGFMKIRQEDSRGNLMENNVPLFVDPYCPSEQRYVLVYSKNHNIILPDTRFVIKELFPNSEFLIQLHPEKYSA